MKAAKKVLFFMLTLMFVLLLAGCKGPGVSGELEIEGDGTGTRKIHVYLWKKNNEDDSIGSTYAHVTKKGTELQAYLQNIYKNKVSGSENWLTITVDDSGAEYEKVTLSFEFTSVDDYQTKLMSLIIHDDYKIPASELEQNTAIDNVMNIETENGMVTGYIERSKIMENILDSMIQILVDEYKADPSNSILKLNNSWKDNYYGTGYVTKTGGMQITVDGAAEADTIDLITGKFSWPNILEDDVFTNELSSVAAADPFVTYKDGYYYGMYTEGWRIQLFRSENLETLLDDESKVIFQPNDSNPVAGIQIYGHIWAPEIHKIGDNYYLFASGATESNSTDGNGNPQYDDPAFRSMRMFYMKLDGTDFWNDTWEYMGVLNTTDLAIDQTVIELDGKIYTSYSKFTAFPDDSNDENKEKQAIWLAVLEQDSEGKLSFTDDEPIMLSYPEYDWEHEELDYADDVYLTNGTAYPFGNDEDVNEGNIFLYNDGKLFLVYSASGCWSEFYKLGMLTYTGDDFSVENVMNVDNWSKSAEPVFEASYDNDVYGVGHNAFFLSPSGTEVWMSFHGMSDPLSGEPGRYLYVQPISFDEDGNPVFGEPLARGTEIKLPKTVAELINELETMLGEYDIDTVTEEDVEALREIIAEVEKSLTYGYYTSDEETELGGIKESAEALIDSLLGTGEDDNSNNQTPGGNDSDNKAPETGEYSNIALWVALILVVIGSVMGTVMYTGKKRSL